MGVRDQLASLGADLGTFNQGDFGSNYSSIAGVNPADGYCAGVCLDWTRRVLQSASSRDARFLNYSKNPVGSAKQTQTLRRMATAYKGQGASYVTTTRQADLVAQLTALLSEADSDWTIDGHDFTGLPVSNGLAQLVNKRIVVTPNPFNLQKEPAAVVKREKVQGWLSFLAGGADPQHSKLADGGREWGQYASELDAQFSQDKKKKFANLFVVTSSNQQTYGSEGAWLGDLLANGFEANRCTIVGLGAPGDTGHAVAVHYVGGDYRFFDPNYGVFKYTKEKLKNALQHLFWTPFFEGTGLDADLPVYRRRTVATAPRDNKPWTRMSYTIFGA